MTDAASVAESALPQVRRVAVDRPWVWLELGWNDLRRAGGVSLAYGAALVVLSYIVTAALVAADLIYLILPITGGFTMVAPMLAVGLYDVSRRLGEGKPIGIVLALCAWRRNAVGIGAMGALLLILHLFWVRVAMLLYPIFFANANPTWETLLENILFSDSSLVFLIVGTAIGGVFAAIVFAISAVSIPMLLDRDGGLIVALATSVTVVRVNWRPMALWAVLIVAFTGFGIVPFYLGLAVVLPLVGHATWHAYKDMVV